MKKLPKLLSTTIVFPEEYNLDKQIRELIKASNSLMNAFPTIDIGKFVGLYIAYARLLEDKK